MRTLIRDTYTSWSKVTCGVPQGSVLAGDAKVLRVIKTQEDCLLLQEDINKIYVWSKKWKLEFNAKKYHIKELGKCKRRKVWNYLVGEEQIIKTKKEKDLG
ncbi:hypothetical protein E2C01_068483 [Portunus trituberculatus]|uniref:Reverse transcriptase domain-containing protein n=1 Tax=Portunus trituberculatus TaxID=210409 RepID=A0A5B7I069_PORTR|nr:hypothetical protein [Portunus trituberculatus]